MGIGHRTRIAIGACSSAALVLIGVGLGLSAPRELSPLEVAPAGPPPAARPDEVARLERTLESLRPRGLYLTIDSVANRVQVRRGREVVREAVCSTGTGAVLEDPATGRRWIFETPKGRRSVLAKRKDPVWVRPDWSYVEEGAELPRVWTDRIDRDMLGEWALDLGDGYMIHGTLFQRYLGRSVTHGCVRLGDEDLAWVAEKIPVGATVLLY